MDVKAYSEDSLIRALLNSLGLHADLKTFGRCLISDQITRFPDVQMSRFPDDAIIR
jgi:hypothetical protein